MPVPKHYEIHKPFLEFLKDGKPHTSKELREYLTSYWKLSEEDLAELVPSGIQTLFGNRVSWAGTYLKKAGLIYSPTRATFIITDEGKRVLQENPLVINANYLRRYEAFRTFQTNSAEDMSENEDTPDGEFEKAFKEINNKLADDLLSEVMKLSPKAFEQMVLDLMAKMGYGTFENSSTTTATTGDEGIDGIIMEDKLGFDLIYIQAKRWNENATVGRQEIQAFVGAIAGKGNKGLFVTTSKFSKQAVDYANQQRIILLDGDKLTNYMIEYNFGVTVKKTFEIKAIDTDVFNDYQ